MRFLRQQVKWSLFRYGIFGFRMISELTLIIFLNSINLLIFVMEDELRASKG
jgi:hypothetical protein